MNAAVKEDCSRRDDGEAEAWYAADPRLELMHVIDDGDGDDYGDPIVRTAQADTSP